MSEQYDEPTSADVDHVEETVDPAEVTEAESPAVAAETTEDSVETPAEDEPVDEPVEEPVAAEEPVPVERARGLVVRGGRAAQAAERGQTEGATTAMITGTDASGAA